MNEPLLLTRKSRPPNFFSRILFLYVFPLLRVANKTPLENEMIPDLEIDD